MRYHATLLYLIGPPAVGKMTMGQELARRTDFHLFHVHQLVDLLTAYFPFGSPPFEALHRTYRRLFVEEAVRAGLNLVMTGGFDLLLPAHRDLLWHWIAPYLEHDGQVLFVELLAPLSVRLQRNQTENRRRHKNVAWATDAYLRDLDRTQHLDTDGAPPFGLPLLRLETTHMAAAEAAHRICAYFHLADAGLQQDIR